jgi:hypothetical protein
LPQGWLAHPSAGSLRRLQAARGSIGIAPASGFMTFVTPTPRCSSSRNTDQGGQRAIGALHARVHHGDVPARPTRHAGGGREDLCRSTGTSYEFRLMEESERSHGSPRWNTRKNAHVAQRRSRLRPSDQAIWWRGEDLNLRPSGYESGPSGWSWLVAVDRSASELDTFDLIVGRCCPAPTLVGRSFAVIALSNTAAHRGCGAAARDVHIARGGGHRRIR